MRKTNIPISIGSGKISDRFKEILLFHIPSGKILDPTCGKKYLWQSIISKDTSLNNFCQIENKWNITFSDIKSDCCENPKNILNYNEFNEKFNGIIYDPPYLFGYHNAADKRKDDYGEYNQSYNEFLNYIIIANNIFPKILENNGKLIVKCSDQYHTKEKKLYLHHITWLEKLTNFNCIDFIIYQHHNMSPTAFQVKNRNSSVIMHTYFMIFELKQKE